MENTSEFFSKQITDGKAEFWTIESNSSLVGKLYLVGELEGRELANGKDTAYLAAFRIEKGFRGKGFGTQLMKKVFERLIRIGYTYATIGVEPDVEANARLYHRLGFNKEAPIMSAPIIVAPDWEVSGNTAAMSWNKPIY